MTTDMFPPSAERVSQPVAPPPQALAGFVKYCEDHPGERFWQALRNWSGYHFILAADIDAKTMNWTNLRDTFEWNLRDGASAGTHPPQEGAAQISEKERADGN